MFSSVLASRCVLPSSVAAVAATMPILVLTAAGVSEPARTHSQGSALPDAPGSLRFPNRPGSIPSDVCVETLTQDGTVTGTWSSARESAWRSGSYARCYTLVLVQTSDVTIRLESKEDTYLFVCKGTGRDGAVLHENDDIESGGDDTSSRISAVLQPGDYTAEVTTYREAFTGDFTLIIDGMIKGVDSKPPPSPAPETKCMDTADDKGAIIGSWDCEYGSAVRSGSYTRYYTFTLTQSEDVSIRLQSEKDIYLFLPEGVGRDGNVLYGHDDTERLEDTDCLIKETLAAGSYRIEATTYDLGVAGDCTLTYRRGVSGDRGALVALFDATGGPDWTDNSNRVSDAPLMEWNGVGVDNNGRVIYLYLGELQLTGELSPELGDLRSLRNLRVGTNLISGEIPPELGDLSNLTQLRLFRNLLSGEIQPKLGNLSSLEYLSLHGNRLSGPIPSELGGLSSLGLIGLSGNLLSGGISPELGSLHNLQGLYLGSNDLSGHVPSELRNLSNLEVLRLGDNARLSGEIPADVLNLPEIVVMYLFGTGLSFLAPGYPAEESALASFYNATAGSDWSRSNNWLSEEPIYQWYEIGVDRSGHVTSRSLAENELSGTLPAVTGNLSYLMFLFLNDNRLTGMIPPELGNLTNLQSLYLAGNSLTGCIPTGVLLLELRGHDHADLGLEDCEVDMSERQPSITEFHDEGELWLPRAAIAGGTLPQLHDRQTQGTDNWTRLKSR